MRKIGLLMVLGFSTSAFAFSASPSIPDVPQDQVDRLVATEVECSLVQARHSVDGVERANYRPSAGFRVTTENRTELWGTPTKCLSNLPLSDNAKDSLGYGCFPVNLKTVKAFNDQRIRLEEDLGYGTIELEYNLETGEGTYSVDVTYGWHNTHEQGEALFRNCKLRK